jgi:hypothetical protein
MKPGRRSSHDDHSTATHHPAPEIIPAARLVIAILRQAAHDYAAGDSGAAAFIRGRHFNFYCDLIGANPDYLRRRLLENNQ